VSRCRLVSLLLCAAAPALVAAGCGGDDSDAENEIIAAIERSATSEDPAACTEVQTQRFTEQISEGTGQAAIESCRKAAGEDTAESIEVSNVEVDGNSATAEGTLTGGFFDGQTVEVALVEEGDQWKLDKLIRFVEFDRDALNAAFVKAIAGDPETPAQVRDCLVTQLESVSGQRLQDLVLNPNDQAFAGLFGPCFQRGG
jgi:hypothetical protein